MSKESFEPGVWSIITEKNMIEISPGDIVAVHNGHEYHKVTVTQHDLNLGTVSNGLHNERVHLNSMNYGYVNFFKKKEPSYEM